MIEKEYKFLLTEEAFWSKRALLQSLYPDCPTEDILQINYYYDTPGGRLGGEHITLRVRQIGNRLKLQCKVHTGQQGNCTTSQEFTESIDQLPQTVICPGNGEECVLQGNLVTHRHRYHPIEGARVEFDENFYLGRADWEVEIEFREEVREEVDLLLAQMGLVSGKKGPGKASRFFLAKDILNPSS